MLVATIPPFNTFEKTIYNDFDPNRKHTEVDDYTQYAPAIAVFTLSASGVKGRNKLPAQVILYGLSNMTGTIITQSLKRITNRQRPDGSDNRSFPSGHTTTAFIAAELLHQEYGHRSVWYSIAGYGTAAVTGYLRLYNNKHWLGDVLAGAAVGMASTRLMYWAKSALKKKETSNVAAPVLAAF
jgi:membrane-associated phospholipid phosphatase